MYNPQEIAYNYIDIGIKKANTSFMRTFLLSVMAGIFIALSGAASLFGNIYVSKLAGAMIFPSGLSMVILAGSELFTGNSLMIISVLEKRVSLLKMLKSWLIVYLGNMVGAVSVSFISVFSGIYFNSFEGVISTALSKTSITFTEGVLRGILCNILVCTAVWMASASESPVNKISSIFLPVSVFVLCGFEHSVANMFFIPLGILACTKYSVSPNNLSWSDFFVKNLIPVTLGNIIGGVFIGVIYWYTYICSVKKHIKHKSGEKPPIA